ncbi:FecR family protein [Sphingobacterium tabacisoli]|uniref:FecR domain-containing protein n=1 Tax=Sphingobacterium tabacisoli TaxID=2044855 RepID=A0ABW5L7D5_9SPHI|nr:FecR family protein [Sphingobacterium tabacisoli]
MDRDQILSLIEKLRANTISIQEHDELLAWYRAVSYQDAVYPSEEQQVKTKILYRLMTNTGFVHQLHKKRSIRRIWYRAAAACILFLFMGSAYYWISQEKTNEQLVVKQNVVDYLPGGNKAQLILEDGSKIDLDGDQSSLLVGDEVTYADGSSVASKIPESKPSGRLQLVTPRGGQYQITLSDGTKVWLNSDSHLKYPLHFTAAERTIELEGEAYFEVAHNHKPFIVKTDRQIIQVLGTKFNVSSYSENTVATTTLLEGSVRVNTSYGNNLLMPGHELVVTTSGTKMNEVYAKDAIAWKDGLFVFDNITLDGVMDKVSRWYNVDIHFADESLKKELVFAVIKKSKSVSVVLDKIASTGVANFRVDRGRISVTNKSKK